MNLLGLSGLVHVTIEGWNTQTELKLEKQLRYNSFLHSKMLGMLRADIMCILALFVDYGFWAP